MEGKFGKTEMEYLEEILMIGGNSVIQYFQELEMTDVASACSVASYLEVEDVAEMLGNEEKVMYSAYSTIEGELEGNLFFAFDERCAHYFTDHLKEGCGSPTWSDQVESSALSEFVNMLVHSYFNRIADRVNSKILLSSPEVKQDMIGALLTHSLIEDMQVFEATLVMRTSFLKASGELFGTVVFIPTYDSIQRYLRAYGAFRR